MNSFFLQGLQHPFFTPAHLIMLIALGILLGQQGRLHGRLAIPVLFALTLAGLAASRSYRPDFELDILLLGLACISGILITLKIGLPRWSTSLIAMLTGTIIGLASTPVFIPGLKASKIYWNMAGSLLSIVLLTAAIFLLAMGINRLWNGIALRIIGSWVFASALMVLALMFAPVSGAS